jgi:hypothetical protein
LLARLLWLGVDAKALSTTTTAAAVWDLHIVSLSEFLCPTRLVLLLHLLFLMLVGGNTWDLGMGWKGRKRKGGVMMLLIGSFVFSDVVFA